ncbi:Arc family DNA-binding protein [Rhizobium leguminosarum]|uniref:Arc family DNA-binding protein n=1 Tax=Rhizobium leguminosarum TaxID=384 RepID=UPI000FF58755|nr:Arc family DNA-binding protein [Rhizobium leguminosarum]RWY82402.1 Arc family DNA-binding protein [Rhizobium leguminosarum]
MARGDFPSTKQDQFNLRLPDGMRDRIADEAAKSGRSMNAEIVHRLANSLENPSFSDMAIGLGNEELDFALMYEASLSGRSLKDEMIYRLQQSLSPEPSLVRELEQRAWEARSRYDDIMKLFIQLTPEERRLLEERAEIAEVARKHKLRSKDVGAFIKLNPIGKRQHFALTLPKSDYSALFGPQADEQTLKDLSNTSQLEDDDG